MKISGRDLANTIRQDLLGRVESLQKKGVTPKIAILTVGEEKTWKVYVNSKLSLAKKIGVKANVYDCRSLQQREIEELTNQLNNDPTVHGIIIQRPFPSRLNDSTSSLVDPKKDIDGFRNDSPFLSPVAEAVRIAIEYICKKGVKEALHDKKIVVIGKGATGGKPTIKYLKKIGIHPTIIDSKTKSKEALIKEADVIISAVGKKIIDGTQIKKGTILIGIGTHIEGGLLRGDYDEEEMDKVASAYTPTPGGIGPLNLTFLFSNLVKAAEQTCSPI